MDSEAGEIRSCLASRAFCHLNFGFVSSTSGTSGLHRKRVGVGVE